MKKYLLIFFCTLINNFLVAQYNMQNLTVYDCEGTLKDSESNALNPTWYSHDENFNFTICPTNALQITINFISFSTERSALIVKEFEEYSFIKASSKDLLEL